MRVGDSLPDDISRYFEDTFADTLLNIEHWTCNIIPQLQKLNKNIYAGPFLSSVEANVYEGVSGYIIMSRKYFIDWTCDYELVYYPFDTQVPKVFTLILIFMLSCFIFWPCSLESDLFWRYKREN